MSFFHSLSINLSQSSELLFLQYKNNKPMSTNPSEVATISFFFSLTFSIILQISIRALFEKIYVPQVAVSYKLKRS